MMRGKSLLGPFFGKFVGKRARLSLAHSAGNFIAIPTDAPVLNAVTNNGVPVTNNGVPVTNG